MPWRSNVGVPLGVLLLIFEQSVQDGFSNAIVSQAEIPGFDEAVPGDMFGGPLDSKNQSSLTLGLCRSPQVASLGIMEHLHMRGSQQCWDGTESGLQKVQL